MPGRLAAILLGVLALAPPAAFAADPVRPDLVADPPDERTLEVDAANARLLMRFDGFMHNAGISPAELWASTPVGGLMTTVTQRIWAPDGSSYEDRSIPATVRYEDNDQHEHFHFQEAARYSLQDPGRDPGGRRLAQGRLLHGGLGPPGLPRAAQSRLQGRAAPGLRLLRQRQPAEPEHPARSLPGLARRLRLRAGLPVGGRLERRAGPLPACVGDRPRQRHPGDERGQPDRARPRGVRRAGLAGATARRRRRGPRDPDRDPAEGRPVRHPSRAPARGGHATRPRQPRPRARHLDR